MRTTLNVDDVVLEQLRRLQAKENKSLGQLASELLAQALAQRELGEATPEFEWTARPMRARFDVADKAQIAAILDAEAYSE